jgi:hypothetical protein
VLLTKKLSCKKSKGSLKACSKVDQGKTLIQNNLVSNKEVK